VGIKGVFGWGVKGRMERSGRDKNLKIVVWMFFEGGDEWTRGASKAPFGTPKSNFCWHPKLGGQGWSGQR